MVEGAIMAFFMFSNEHPTFVDVYFDDVTLT